MSDSNKEIERLKKRIAGLEKTLQIVTGYSGRVEKNLKQVFDVISETIPVPMVITSKKTGTILFSNSRAQKIFGYSKERFHLINALDLFDQKKDYIVFEEMLATDGEVKGFNLSLKQNNHATFPASLFSNDISFEGQDCLVTVVYDLSHLKKEEEKRLSLEKKIRQTQKMEALGTLAGGIAHDLNNILFGIIGFTELCLSEPQQNENQSHFLQGILKAALRAKDLVKQVLTFSRFQPGQDFKPIHMKYIIKEVMHLFKASLPKTIEIIENINSNTFIMGDMAQIHQIIMNLLTNAGYAMQENGGILEITLLDLKIDHDNLTFYPELKPGNYSQLTVRDTGVGISPDIKDKIFDPFFTTKPKGDGTGLGLSVIHGIVKNHGGIISVYSEPNQGATFSVILPAKELTPKKNDTHNESILLPKGSEHILLVDDEEDLINMLERMLISLGYQITPTMNSHEALMIFKKNPNQFDLVITDMTMPQMTGKELAKQLLSIKPDLPIIICTGYSTNINKESALKMGIQSFIIKPILKRDLAITIREVLDKNNTKGV